MKFLVKCMVLAVVFLFAISTYLPSANALQGSVAGSETTAAAGASTIFPAVIATIDGKPISGRELEVIIRRELAPIGNPEWNNLRDDYRGQLTFGGITSLINSRLLYQKALADKVQASDAEVQVEMDKIAKTYKSDAEMNEALAQQLMDKDSLRKSLLQSMTIAKYIDTVVSKPVTVTPEELTKYYKEHLSDFAHPELVRVSHILIRAGTTAEQDAMAKQRAESLLARVKKGEDFATLAKENSADTSASAGGDLGFAPKDAMDPMFADPVFSMSVGELRLVESTAGYHVVKLVDKKKEGVATLEEAKADLTQFLKNEKVQTELTKLINQLREKSKIEVLIPYGQPLVP